MGSLFCCLLNCQNILKICPVQLCRKKVLDISPKNAIIKLSNNERRKKLKLNPHGNFEDMDIKRMQVVYLREVEHLTPREIVRFVDYSINTVKCYMYKFKHLLEKAKELFEKAVVTIVSKIDFVDEEKTEKCYLFKFYDGENILFSKIGTTTRKVVTRLKEEIKSYTKAGFSISKVVIEDVVNCGDIPAEGLESFCRAKFILKYPNTFKKNDRFMGVDIPVKVFQTVTKNYFA